jgi:hypothetical protein
MIIKDALIFYDGTFEKLEIEFIDDVITRVGECLPGKGCDGTGYTRGDQKSCKSNPGRSFGGRTEAGQKSGFSGSESRPGLGAGIYRRQMLWVRERKNSDIDCPHFGGRNYAESRWQGNNDTEYK